MTDARIPGQWLAQRWWTDLSPSAVRLCVFAMQWCNQQGGDGRIPQRYLATLFPGADDPVPIAELEATDGAVQWRRDGYDYVFPLWSVKLIEQGMGQSTAAEVEANRKRAREKQQAWRDRQKTASSAGVPASNSSPANEPRVTGDVTGNGRSRAPALPVTSPGYVTPVRRTKDVGTKGDHAGTNAHARAPKSKSSSTAAGIPSRSTASDGTGWPVVDIPSDGGTAASAGDVAARPLAEYRCSVCGLPAMLPGDHPTCAPEAVAS